MSHAVDMSVLESCEPTTTISPEELTLISEWLDAFESDTQMFFVMDQSFRLWKDYSKFSEQNRALLALLNKIDTSCYKVSVTAPAGSNPMLGSEWAHLDDHRTWLLAVALVPSAQASIVNATHIEWENSRLPKTQNIPPIMQLLPEWLAAFVRGLVPPDVQANYVPPPKTLSGSLSNAVAKGCGKNGRKAWEDATYRYEWDYQHGRVEVYTLSNGTWVHEAEPDGTISKTSGGTGRDWGR